MLLTEVGTFIDFALAEEVRKVNTRQRLAAPMMSVKSFPHQSFSDLPPYENEICLIVVDLVFVGE